MTVILYLRQPSWILTTYYDDPTKDFVRALFTGQLMSRALIAVIFIAVFAVFLLLQKTARRRSIASLVIGLLIAFNISTSLSMELGGMTHLLLPIGTLWNAVFILGAVLTVSRTVDVLYLWLNAQSSRPAELRPETADTRTRAILSSFFCLWVCWIPGLMLCYPGGANPDTIQQVESWLGLYQIEASNPLLATALYGISFSLGRAFRSDNAGWFCAILMQAAVCSAGITVCGDHVRKLTGSKRWQTATVLFFALLPTWQNAMVQLLKDVLHTGCFLLFYVWYLRALEEKGEGRGTFLKLFIGAFIISYTRKAAFYIALIAIIVVVIVQRKRYLKQAVACLLATLVCFYAPGMLIYPMLNIEGEREEENYSMQLQQIGYYCSVHHDELTQEEIDIINGTVDYNAVLNDFTPQVSDPIKKTYHGTAEDHAAFWKLYREFFARHPLTMLQAIYACTFEHMDPWYDYAFEYGISEGSTLQIYHTDSSMMNIVNYWESWRKVPLLRMTLVTGLYAWITMALVGYAIKKRSLRILYGLIPAFVLFVGLFMSHVNGMLRYGYPLVAVGPLLLAWAVGAGREQAVQTEEAVVSAEAPARKFAFHLPGRLLKGKKAETPEQAIP